MLLLTKLFIGAGTTALISNYFYRTHLYNKKIIDSYNKCIQSGTINLNTKETVYVCMRQAFPGLKLLKWIIPYHVSLEIIDKDGNTRHVGIGESPTRSRWFDTTSEFRFHTGPDYEYLNNFEMKVRLECWPDYEIEYGEELPAIPLIIDKLNALTITREEAIAQGKPLDTLYMVPFGKPTYTPGGRIALYTCHYAVLTVLREAVMKSRLNN